MPKSVFISYSHKDDVLRAELEVHLKVLKREGLIDVWSDREIAAGDEWRGQIDKNLEEADIVLLLVSASFIASDYCWDVETSRALERHAKGEVRVVPVIVRPCRFNKAPFAELKVLPRDGKPVVKWPTHDDGWVEVVEGLAKILEAEKLAIPDEEAIEPAPDDPTQSLKALYRRRKELTLAGADTQDINTQILDLRRQLRQGPQLHPGEYLADGRYELIEVIGQGGFATVWKAWDEKMGELVAVKVLHGHLSSDRSKRERFFRGARKMDELPHPYIVRVLDPKCDDEGWYFYVMEYLDGGSFEQAVLEGKKNTRSGKERIPLSEADRIKILLEVGAALTHAHDQGVVHRDVKPSNVLLTTDGTAKLTDFDLVRAEDTTGLTHTQAMMGTVLFAAPETLGSAATAGPTADVYSFGATAVFALQGSRLPAWFYRDPKRAVDELSCDDRLKQALGKAVALEATDRWQSMSDVCRALERPAAESEPVLARSKFAVTPSLEDLFEWIDGRVELWREIPAGEGWIGSPEGEGYKWEWPRHRAEVVRSFAMTAVPVTNAQFAAFKPRHTFEDDKALYPVVNIDWREAMAFCRWLEQAFLWARGARLPTEEEWEYACRAHTETCYWSGDSEGDLALVGWYDSNSGSRLHHVGEKESNPWGLYDMHGNVREWTLTGCDWKAFKTAYKNRKKSIVVDPTIDPDIAFQGSGRVIRGGGFEDSADWARTAYRAWNIPYIGYGVLGFRVMLPHPRTGRYSK